MLKRDAQLVHLVHAGHRVDSDRAEWDGTAGRYLRLLWDDPQRAPEIQSVFLGTVETSFNPPVHIWSGEIAPSATQPGIYDYAWAGQMPLEKLRIDLPEINNVAPRPSSISRQRNATRPGLAGIATMRTSAGNSWRRRWFTGCKRRRAK